MVAKHVKDFNDYCARIAEYLGEKDSFVFAKLLGKVSSFMRSEPRQARMKAQSQKHKHQDSNNT